MKEGICEICYARLCIPCGVEMEITHFVNRLGEVWRGQCERCGKKTMTMKYRYLMRGAEMKRRGLKLR